MVLDELGDARLCEGKCSRHVEVECIFERLGGDIGDCRRRRSASVVHDDVDFAEFFDCGIGELAEEIELVDIAGKDECTPTETADSGGDLFELVSTACSDGNVGAGFGEGEGRCSADATSGTSDDGDLAINAETIKETHGARH
ncbi:unannotated protein [freshwater metagenome]|uniref:Unannotated protein n=1 Tax=freshwater metagenome TaxID=449393 RepID=A0A6J6JV92_9ZZZZ